MSLWYLRILSFTKRRASIFFWGGVLKEFHGHQHHFATKKTSKNTNTKLRWKPLPLRWFFQPPGETLDVEPLRSAGRWWTGNGAVCVWTSICLAFFLGKAPWLYDFGWTCSTTWQLITTCIQKCGEVGTSTFAKKFESFTWWFHSCNMFLLDAFFLGDLSHRRYEAKRCQKTIQAMTFFKKSAACGHSDHRQHACIGKCHLTTRYVTCIILLWYFCISRLQLFHQEIALPYKSEKLAALNLQVGNIH